MNEFFEDIYREYEYVKKSSSNIIQASKSKIAGKTKISVAEDGKDNVKVMLKKDIDDSIKEIKFICSCGKTKSLLLDYFE